MCSVQITKSYLGQKSQALRSVNTPFQARSTPPIPWYIFASELENLDMHCPALLPGGVLRMRQLPWAYSPTGP